MKLKIFFCLASFISTVAFAQNPYMPPMNVTYPCAATATVTGQISWLTPEQCQVATAMNRPLPNGNYVRTCTAWWNSPDILAASCQNPWGDISYSTLNITPSCQFVQNINGQLSCN
jgi:hypothetical protein